MSNAVALDNFRKAREYYLARRFEQARTTMPLYRQTIDYRQFKQQDKRPETKPETSVVIVGYGTGPKLLKCIQSVLAQQGPRFEIILVDNGQNEDIHAQLAALPIRWITSPINLLPSEGRNIGAHCANSDILVFLDDDAIMASGYLAAVQTRAEGNKYLALRGRIQPKTPTATPTPKHYDLGETELPCEFNLEGNMVIRRSLFQKLGGFDPLMFGHEGKALSQQWHNHFSGKDIRYCPELIIHHDWRAAEKLDNKRERQALGKDYLEYLKDNSLNAGVTIILRAGENLAEAKTFLEGLAKHNSYKPIEVLIWAKDTPQAVNLTRKYQPTLKPRVLRTKITAFQGLSNATRYENVLIIDIPTNIELDALPIWISRKCADVSTVLVLSKPELMQLTAMPFQLPLAKIAHMLGKMRSTNDVSVFTGDELTSCTTQPNTTYTKTEPSTNKGNNKTTHTCIDFSKKSADLNRSNLIAVCGIASIPERQSNLEKVISSIYHQFDQIYVYLNNYSKVPSFLRKKKIIIETSQNCGDLGAAGKYFFRDSIKEGYYFSVDDDFIYPSDYRRNMVDTLLKYGNNVIVTVHGSIFPDNPLWYLERLTSYSASSPLEYDTVVTLPGTATVAFHAALPVMHSNALRTNPYCDLLLATQSNQCAIPIISVSRKRSWLSAIATSVSGHGRDYFTDMINSEMGRTELIRRFDWTWYRHYSSIVPQLRKLDFKDCDLEKLYRSSVLDARTPPPQWRQDDSLLFQKRRFQFLTRQLRNSKKTINQTEFTDVNCFCDDNDIKIINKNDILELRSKNSLLINRFISSQKPDLPQVVATTFESDLFQDMPSGIILRHGKEDFK